MNPNHLREFAMRERAPVQEAKAQYWAERFRIQGWEANWRTAQELAAYVRRVRPDFPTARDRDEDLAHHVKLKDLLDRAAHAFSCR
jgi:hypothetical protein